MTKKVKIAFSILVLMVLFSFTACTDKEAKDKWQDNFSYTVERIEQSQFDDADAELEALLNGTFVFAHRDFVVTNKTDKAFKNVYLEFLVVVLNDENFYFKAPIGNISPHQVYTESVLDTRVEIEMRERNIDPNQWWSIAISNITYEEIK